MNELSIVGLFGLVCLSLGFWLGWLLKPQKKEVSGSVRGPGGKFVKRSADNAPTDPSKWDATKTGGKSGIHYQ